MVLYEPRMRALAGTADLVVLLGVSTPSEIGTNPEQDENGDIPSRLDLSPVSRCHEDIKFSRTSQRSQDVLFKTKLFLIILIRERKRVLLDFSSFLIHCCFDFVKNRFVEKVDTSIDRITDV